MNEFNSSEPEPGPALLADYLAELLKRFRHFSTPLEPARGMASHLARLKVSGRLLAALAGASGHTADGFRRLGMVLAEWVAFYESSPESFPPYLTSSLERLADYLEELLTRRDQGVSGRTLHGDEGWRTVLASFRHAGTPLSILDDVNDLFRKWAGRWTDENLTPVQEKQLRRRWLSLRKRGDVLFQAELQPRPWVEEISGPGSGSPRILLLVDSTFRRDQIADKLTERGFRVELPSDPAQALEFLTAGPEPTAVLCDNLEPTLHLARLREGLSSSPRQAIVPMVLVVGSSLAGAADESRALALGAVAAWRDPFDPMDLSRILQRLPRP